MKTICIILFFFSYGNMFSQDLDCLNSKFYNSNYDVVQIQNSSDSEYDVSKTELKDESLQLIVLPNSSSEFPKWSTYKRKGIDKGFKVILVNNSSKDFSLWNMDGKIIMRRQVYYDNEWRNVESYDRTPQGICGNSFFTNRVIESGSHFNFVAPCLEGDIKVKVRFVIFTKPTNEQSPIFSNEIEGFLDRKLIY